MVDNGVKGRALPADCPPWPTVRRFAAWEKAGVTELLLAGLTGRVRVMEGRSVAPSAAVIDSQSVRASPTVSASTRGYDATKKVNGRKRHIAVDTLGLLVAVLVTPASSHDRLAALALLRRLRNTAGNRLTLVWADGAYSGKLLQKRGAPSASSTTS